MFTIREMVMHEIMIKKSRFIAVLQAVDSIEEVEETLAFCKKAYPNAKHYTYAYIIDDKEKCSDDKEPSKTAGAPILNILKKNQLTHVLCVVIRYFGGILLGAPGLVRAYASSAKEVLDEAVFVPYIQYMYYQIVFSYTKEKIIHSLLSEELILRKTYHEVVCYEIKIDVKNKALLEQLKQICIEVKKSD